jgi:hypothetical protein
MPQVKTTLSDGHVTAIDIVYSHEEKELAAKAAQVLDLNEDEVDPEDFWECPGCGTVNSFFMVHINQRMPIAYGSCFETCCGACRQSFAPITLDDGAPNPILFPVFTHGGDR